jgi:uncharacterized membrane protein
MKLYLTIILLLLCNIFTFGFALPMLISAKSTELVVIGIIVLVFTPVLDYYLIKSVINQLKSKLK